MNTYDGFNGISHRIHLSKTIAGQNSDITPMSLLKHVEEQLAAKYKNEPWQNGVVLRKADKTVRVTTNYRGGVGLLESIWFELYVTQEDSTIFCFAKLRHLSISGLKKSITASIDTIEADFKAFIRATETILKS